METTARTTPENKLPAGSKTPAQHISDQIKAMPKSETEPTLNEFEKQSFEELDNLFHTYEDTYNDYQDAPLLSMIEQLNSVNDKVKIKWLFKKYRDEARENHAQVFTPKKQSEEKS